MKTLYFLLFFWFFFLIQANISNIVAQEKRDSVMTVTPSINLTYVNLSNDTIVLTANLFIKREQGVFAIKNAGIVFEITSGNDINKFGEATTDEEGNAILKTCIKKGLLADKEGKSVFTAKFPGRGNYLSASESITVKQAKLTVNFSKVDSLRYVLITAKQVEGNGTIHPIGKLSVNLYVPRLFTPLKIGELTLEEDGTGKLEYPGNIVGDSLGNIVIIAKIEENDLYGNVQGQSSITWGVPKQYYLAEMPTRELWTPIAPLWMIVTLITMLTGVWAHYFYAIIQLVLIRRSSRQKKP
jgi:hypothetical protein